MMNTIKKILLVCLAIFSISTLWAQSEMQIADKDYYRSLENLASGFKDAGRYSLADSIYNEMLLLSKQNYGDSSLEYSKVLSDLGKVRIEQQLFAGVEDMLKTALDIREQVVGENSMEYAETLNVLGKYYTFTGKIKSAEPVLLKASEIQLEQKGSDDFSYILSLIDLGTLKFVARDFSESERYYKQSVTLGCKDSEPLTFGGLFCLSTLYAAQGRYPEAKTFVGQYITAIRDKYPKEHPNYIAALTNLGGLQVIANEFDEAEQTLLETLKLCAGTFGEQHIYYIHTLSALSVLYSKTGQYEKAEPLTEKSLSIRKALYGQNHPEIVTGLNNLAALYLKTGNYDKAIQAVTEAVEVTKQTTGENSLEYVKLSNVLANVYINKKEFEKAYPILLHADSLLTTIEGGHRELELALLNNMNVVLFKINSVDDNVLEEKLTDVIEKKNRLIGENDSYYLSLNNLASFYDERGRHSQARALFDTMLIRVERNIGKESLLYHNILLNSSINYELMDSIQQAKHSFELLLQLSKERVSSHFAFMSESERELYWKTLNNNIKRCQSFADRYKAKDPTLAYLAYDCELFSKNLLLNSSQAVRQSILDSNNEQLIANWNKLMTLKSNTQSNADTIRLLEKQLMVNSKEYQQQQTNFSITWEDVVFSLKEDEAAIEFITYETPDSAGIVERVYAALILRRNGSKAGIAMLTQCKESSLRQALNSSDYDFGKLYPFVWDSMDEHLNGVKKIYISPTGLLNSVPFAVLKNKGEYISDKYTIHTVLSSKDLISLKDNSNQSFDKNAVLFGGADFGLSTAELDRSDDLKLNDRALRSLLTEFQEERGQGFDYLPGSRQEVEKISKILSKLNWNVTTFIDKNATETNLKAYLSQGHSHALLHLSTHGYYFPLVKEPSFTSGIPESSEANKFYKHSDNPLMRCGLLFSGANSTWNGQGQAGSADDGILTAYEISNLNLSNTDLVVLSACETGLGDVDYSEGVYGLQRAFRLAGAKSMIVSLWKVSDKDALEFMVEFYQQWALSKDKKEAFDKAQDRMRKKHDQVKKWAGFVLIE